MGPTKARSRSHLGWENFHVSSTVWLENNVFLVIHTATNGQDPSVYHLITREQAPGVNPSFTFQKLTDPVEPFGSEKIPHHSVLRLREFAPGLQDLLIVSSTATESIGLLTRSKTPLTPDKPADKISNIFTATELADDSRRAQLPMSEDLMETFAIGTALDLSGKDKVFKPIPSDEIEFSPGPLPGLWVLNNEGVLSSWWIVYKIRFESGTTYSGLSILGRDVAATPSQSAPGSGSAFGSATGTASAFGTPTNTAPAFGGRFRPWSQVPLVYCPWHDLDIGLRIIRFWLFALWKQVSSAVLWPDLHDRSWNSGVSLGLIP